MVDKMFKEKNQMNQEIFITSFLNDKLKSFFKQFILYLENDLTFDMV